MALTKYNYNSFDVTPVASKAMGFNSDADGLTSISPSSMVLIKEQTASDDSTLDFVNGTDDVVLDGTYPIYLFKCINMHPASDNVRLGFNMTADGTNFNVTKTTTFFDAIHFESDTEASLSGYQTSQDLAQGTGLQHFSPAVGNGNDESFSAEMFLFSPSSTTFAKHFMSRGMGVESRDIAQDTYVAGYCNTTSAITGVRFQAASGNLDAGTIKLYGIKDS